MLGATGMSGSPSRSQLMASSWAAEGWEAPQAEQMRLLMEAASKTHLISNVSWPRSLIRQENVYLLCYSSNVTAFCLFFWALLPLAGGCSWLRSGNFSVVTQIVSVHYCNWNLYYWRRADVRLAKKQGPNLGRSPVSMRGKTPGRCLIAADQVILTVEVFYPLC